MPIRSTVSPSVPGYGAIDSRLFYGFGIAVPSCRIQGKLKTFGFTSRHVDDLPGADVRMQPLVMAMRELYAAGAPAEHASAASVRRAVVLFMLGITAAKVNRLRSSSGSG
jgi:hypothetical protein